MTKAELVNTISNKLGTEKNETQKVVEAFMQEIRNTAIEIPAHNIPAFKPSKSFVEKVKTKVAVK